LFDDEPAPVAAAANVQGKKAKKDKKKGNLGIQSAQVTTYDSTVS
jgi:hypothetical protein